MKIRTASHSMGGMFLFLLLAMFLVLSILLVVIGSQAYRTVVARSDDSSDVRLAVNFLVNKVHGADYRGEITVRDGALVLPADYGEERFSRYIYLYNGYLMEQLVGPDEERAPEVGERILQVRHLTFSAVGDGVAVTLETMGGATESTYIAFRSQ